MIYSILIVIGISLALYFFVFKEKSETQETPLQTKEDIENNHFKNNVEKLFNINIFARENIEDNSINSLLEEVIDSMRNISEEINKFENFGEESVIFSRMVERYLPSLVTDYINLDDNSKETQKTSFIEKLNTLKNEVTLIEKDLNESSEEKFEKTSRLISAMLTKFEGDK